MTEDDDDDDDATGPAQFVLKLPPSYARKLAALSPPTPREWALPVTAAAPSPVKSSTPSRRAVAFIAGAAVAVAIVVGVGGAFAKSSGGPVGISTRAPKALEHGVRSAARQSGVAHVQVAVERHHAKAKHKR